MIRCHYRLLLDCDLFVLRGLLSEAALLLLVYLPRPVTQTVNFPLPRYDNYHVKGQSTGFHYSTLYQRKQFAQTKKCVLLFDSF